MLARSALTIYSDGLYYSELVTDRVQSLVSDHTITDGLVNLVVCHTTSALLLVEHEAGIIVDIKETMEQVLSSRTDYHHHLRGVDENGAAHVLSALFNRPVTLPVRAGRLDMGTYQDVLFMDFQRTVTEREIVVTLLGE